MEKEKPRTNPRAGSNNAQLWDTQLDWYFNEFESLCGIQSIGTSGAGENQLSPMSDAEKADRQERTKNGFLLTMIDHAKADMHSVSADAADRAAFTAMAHGIFRKGRTIWKKLTRLSYFTQQVLEQAYKERIPEAGADWGRPPLNDAQVAWAHREYLGIPNTGPYPANPPVVAAKPTSRPWRNTEAVPRHLFALLPPPRMHSDEYQEEDVVDVVEFIETGMAVYGDDD